MKINITNIILFLTLLFSILPAFVIGDFSFPVLFILLPICFLYFLLIILGKIKISKEVKILIIFFILIIIQILSSSLIASLSFKEYAFPRDIIQYISRFSLFLYFYIIFSKRNVSQHYFTKLFILSGIVAMLIGILQWIPWGGRELFIKLYPFRDGALQMSQLNRLLSNIRVHGFAQHANALGGISVFYFMSALITFIYKSNIKVYSIVLMIISIVSLFISQSRSGYLFLIFSLVSLIFFDIRWNDRKLKSISIIFLGLITGGFLLFYMFKNDNIYLLRIFEKFKDIFNENSSEGRFHQIEYFFQFIDTPSEFLLGLSKQFINSSLIPYGIEIEPLNIFITYGIIGFILQYSMIVYLIIVLKKNIFYLRKVEVILIPLIAYINLIGYQFFSLGYYFFREIRVGLIPWIILGAAMGIIDKMKELNRIENFN